MITPRIVASALVSPLLVLSLAVGVFSYAPPTHAAVSTWQKGATIDPLWSGDFGSSSFRQSLQDLVADHANAVSLAIPYYQSTRTSHDMGPGWNTPSDASLLAGIDAAHALGLSVTLNVHIETNDHAWRATIDPTDRDAWFSAYGDLLRHYAQLAQSRHVEQLCIGTELISLTSPSINPTNTQHWKDIIADLRTIYDGKLIYSANHGGGGIMDEKNVLGFWSDLDVIGLSAYHPLSQRPDASVDELNQEWNAWDLSEVQPLADKYHKPIQFIEVGFRSIQGAHMDPSSWSIGGCFDAAEQARDYQSLFSYWNDQPEVTGMFLWDWKSHSGAGGSGDTGFTPQGKPAEQLMAQWFGTGHGFATTFEEWMTAHNQIVPTCVAAVSGASSSLVGDTSSSISSGGSSSSAGEGGASSSLGGGPSSGSSSSSDTSGGGNGGGGDVGGSPGGSGGSNGGDSGGPGGGSTGGGAPGATGGSTGGSGSPGGNGTTQGGGVPPPAFGGGSPNHPAGIPPPAYGGGRPVIPTLPPATGRGMASNDHAADVLGGAALLLFVIMLAEKPASFERYFSGR